MPRRSCLSPVKTLVLCALLVAGVAIAMPTAGHAAGPFQYHAVTPCRVVDTRNPTGTDGGPALTANATRTFSIQGACGVPVGAQAVTINVTIAGPSLSTSGGFVTLFP